MTYMDIKPAATTELDQYLDWTNHLTARLVSSVGKKIEITPEIGELRIQWYTELAQAEGCGEIVTVERWNGYGWEQHGLDAHDTVQDLFDMDWKLVAFDIDWELGGEL